MCQHSAYLWFLIEGLSSHRELLHKQVMIAGRLFGSEFAGV